MKTDVTIEDVKELVTRCGISLSEEEANNALSEYNRIVMDRADDWEEILKQIVKQ